MYDPVPVFAIGYTFGVRNAETHNAHLALPRPPANYKNKEAIEKWQESHLERWQQEGGGSLVAGTLKSICALNISLREGWVSTDHGEKFASEFLDWLLAGTEKSDPLQLFGHDVQASSLAQIGSRKSAVQSDQRAEFWGFGIHRFFRLLAADCLRQGTLVPRSLWMNYERRFDPMDCLVEQPYRGLVTLKKLCEEAPTPFPVAEAYETHKNAEQDCLLTTELCFDYQLFDPEDIICSREKLFSSLPQAFQPDAVAEPGTESGEESPST